MAEIPGSNPGEPTTLNIFLTIKSAKFYMSTSEKPVITEQERLAEQILEEEGDDIETINKVNRYVLDKPVSHYRCVWADEDSIIPVWEDVDNEQET